MSERVYSESSKERKHFPETKKRKQRTRKILCKTKKKEHKKHFPELRKRTRQTLSKTKKKNQENIFKDKEREPGKHFQRQRKKSTKNKTQKTVTAHKSLINKTYPKPFKTESKNY